MQLEGKAGLSIVEACDAARLSRAGFYRHFDETCTPAGRHGVARAAPPDLPGSPLLRLTTGYRWSSGRKADWLTANGSMRLIVPITCSVFASGVLYVLPIRGIPTASIPTLPATGNRTESTSFGLLT